MKEEPVVIENQNVSVKENLNIGDNQKTKVKRKYRNTKRNERTVD